MLKRKSDGMYESGGKKKTQRKQRPSSRDSNSDTLSDDERSLSDKASKGFSTKTDFGLYKSITLLTLLA